MARRVVDRERFDESEHTGGEAQERGEIPECLCGLHLPQLPSVGSGGSAWRSRDLAEINPGDIIILEHENGQAQEICAVCRVFDESSSPEW